MRRLFSLLFLCWLSSAFAYTYTNVNSFSEDFETGLRPTNWVEWNFLQNHPMTWASGTNIGLTGTNSIKFHGTGDTNYAIGAFGRWPFASRNVSVQFRFMMNEYPPIPITEICDLYTGSPIGGNGDEVCDVYVASDGRVAFQIGGQTVSIPTVLPTNTIVNFWIHYQPSLAGPSYGSVGWSTNLVEPTSGSQFVSRFDGVYHTTVDRLLFGPMQSSNSFFIFDDLVVTTAPLPASDLRIIGNVSVSGNVTFR